MASVYRVLYVLMTVRLLLPPGICVCELASPASYYLTHFLGGEAPPPAPEDDNDHDPGCPASPLAAGMGVSPPAGPFSPDLVSHHFSCGSLCPPAAEFSPTGPCDRPEPHPLPPAGPLYLTACALLI